MEVNRLNPVQKATYFLKKSKVGNKAQLVIISFSSAVRVAKRYSRNQNIFVGFSEMVKNFTMKNQTLSKVAFISFRG